MPSAAMLVALTPTGETPRGTFQVPPLFIQNQMAPLPAVAELVALIPEIIAMRLSAAEEPELANVMSPTVSIAAVLELLSTREPDSAS
ncbi:hypothetical protein D3C87_1191510 [compost metagenome]